VVKTQGRRGEVAAELHTDFPERFAERRRIYALGSGGGRRQLQLENSWPHLGYFILKFQGVDSITDAEQLVGYELQIPVAERAPLEPEAAYVSDLVGCGVWDVTADRREIEIGVVADVQFGAGEAPLLVVRSGKKEFLIPFAAEYLRALDLPGRRVEMALPDGLLEVDGPLTEEEKRRQRGEG
jgi:16S rRNA processing protein RimM